MRALVFIGFEAMLGKPLPDRIQMAGLSGRTGIGAEHHGVLPCIMIFRSSDGAG